MLYPTRIPANDAEHTAIDKLGADHPGESLHVTRRDPGDTGPLIVEVGETIYEVAEDGTVTNG